MSHAYADLPNPSAEVNEFPLYINLALLPQGWWDAVDTSDGTKGRVYKSGGVQRLPCDWIDFDDVGQTGWLRVRWDQITSSGTKTIWIEPPIAANASVAPGDPFGQYETYIDFIIGSWPDGGADRTQYQHNGTGFGTAVTRSLIGKCGYGRTYGGGAGDYVAIPDDDTLTAIPFTWMFWLKSDSTTKRASMVQKAGADAAQREYFIEVNDNIDFGCLLWSASSFGNCYVNHNLVAGTWKHLAVFWAGGAGVYPDWANDGGTIEDSRLESGTIDATTFPNRTSDLEFGRSAYNTARSFEGVLSDLILFNQVMSQAWYTYEHSQTNDNAAFWGTWQYDSGSVEYSATAAASQKSQTMVSAATASPAPVTGTTVEVDPTGNIVKVKSILESGSWTSPAIDPTKEISFVASPGGHERTMDGYLDTLAGDGLITVSTTNTANDTAEFRCYLTGDGRGNPQFDGIHTGEAVQINLLEAGLIWDADSTSPAATGSVTNNSTAEWPKVIFRWAFDPDDGNSVINALVTGTTLRLFFTAFHKYGINLTSSTMTLTDSLGGTHSGSLAVEELTHDSSVVSIGERHRIYVATFNLTGAADGAFSVDADIYPAFGPSTTAERHVASVDSYEHVALLDKASAKTTATAYVDTRVTIPVGAFSGTLTPLSVLLGGTSGARAVVDPSSSLTGPTLTLAYSHYAASDNQDPLSGGFQSGETLTEYVYGRLLVGGEYIWVQSGSGTNEYYVRTNQGGGDPGFGGITITSLKEDTNAVTWAAGTIGALGLREYALGDNDGLGYTTLYVRLANEVDPSTLWDGFLAMNYETGISMQATARHTGMWSGTPALGDPNNPYGSIHRAFRAIQLYVESQDGAKDSAGCTVYMKAGIQHFRCIDQVAGNVGDDTSAMSIIARDPAAAKADVIVMPVGERAAGGWLDEDGVSQAVIRCNLRGFTFRHLDNGNPSVTKGLYFGAPVTPNPSVWIHDVQVSSRNGSNRDITANARYYYQSNTDSNNIHHVKGGGGPYTGGNHVCIMNSRWHGIHFQGDMEGTTGGQHGHGFCWINVEVDELEGRFSSPGNHSDLVQASYRYHNVVIFNFRTNRCRYQGFFLAAGVRNFALVNVMVSASVDDDTTQDPVSGMGSSMFSAGDECRHILLWNHTHQDWLGENNACISMGFDTFNGSMRNVMASAHRVGPQVNAESGLLPVNTHCIQEGSNLRDTNFGVRHATGGTYATLFTNGHPSSLNPYPLDEVWAGRNIWRPGETSVITTLLARDLQSIADGQNLALYDIYGDEIVAGAHVGASTVGGAVLFYASADMAAASQTAAAVASFVAAGGGTIDKPVASGDDDGSQLGDGTANFTGQYTTIQGNSTATARRNALWRFTGISIPGGMTLNTVKLQLYTTDAGEDMNARFHFEDTIASQNLIANPTINNRAVTPENVLWDEEDASVNDGWIETPELRDVLKALIADNSGSLSGADLSVIALGDTRNFLIYPSAYERSPAEAAILHVDYAPTTTPTASVSKVKDDVLAIEFSEVVYATDGTGITVNASGGAVTVTGLAAGSGSRVLSFTLSRAIAPGETVTFDLDGSASTIQNYGDASPQDETLFPVQNDAATAYDFAAVEAGGRSVLVSSIITGMWHSASYVESWMLRETPLAFLVDAGGANERIVECIPATVRGGQSVSTHTTTDDMISVSLPLTGKIASGESVEIAASYGAIHDDGTNTSSAIPEGDPVANNSTASATAPAATMEVKAPSTMIGPCVVSALLRLEDFDAGDLSKMQDCEIDWWVSGATTADQYRLITDPELNRNQLPVDYTADGNYKSIGGASYILSEGSYRINARIRNIAGDTTVIQSGPIDVLPDTRTVVTVNSAGGAAHTSLAAAYAAQAGNDQVRFDLADGHTEVVSSTLVVGGSGWWIRHAGVGTRPVFTEDGTTMFSGSWRLYENTIYEGFDFDPTWGATETIRGGFVGIKTSGDGGVGMVDLDFGGEFTTGVGGQRLDTAIWMEGEGFPLVAVGCSTTWTSGYSYVGGSGSLIYEGVCLVGNDFGRSSNESVIRTVGPHRYFTSAYNRLEEDSKSALRHSDGITVWGSFRDKCDGGDIWLGAVTANATGIRVGRVDSMKVGGVLAGITIREHAHSLRVVNVISDDYQLGWGFSYDASNGDYCIDVEFEFCTVVQNGYFASGGGGNDSGENSVRFYGCLYKITGSPTYVYDIGDTDSSLGVRGAYNIYDSVGSPSTFARRQGAATTYETFAQWSAKAFNINEQQMSFVLASNYVPSVLVPAPLKTTSIDYWGHSRLGGESYSGAVVANPVVPTFEATVSGSHKSQTIVATAVAIPIFTATAVMSQKSQTMAASARFYSVDYVVPYFDAADLYQIRVQKEDIYKLPRRL